MSEINTVGLAGAGTMGAGIAIVAARGGFDTISFDLESDVLTGAVNQTAAFFGKSVERGKLEQGEVDTIIGRMRQTTSLEDLADCDVVIEAVFEDVGVKQDLFSALNDICPAETIFASNTSTLSITEIAGPSGRDDRCVGMHFCLPAQLNRLVEMSPGLNTSDATFETAWAFCKAMGQIPVKTKDSPGFILNHFLIPFNNDVVRMVDAGVAEPADIDKAIKTALGYPLGPCELLDMVGMDTQRLVSEALHEASHDPRAACPALVKKMIAAGRLGRKSGRGFFDYKGPAMFGA
tara:strand:+ start:963 stop:1838 length:876 start_codon:yes stop_codon:yes gene_type:complete